MKYLEVGAFDGITHSNTLILHKRLGWDGILVEPIDQYFQLLKINRPNDICIKSILTSKKNIKLKMFKNGAISKIIPENKLSKFKLTIKNIFMKNRIEFVESTTVNQLLSDHQMTRLDFISLDVEGMEYDVLQGIDFNTVDVTAILIECHRYPLMDIIEKMYENNFVLAEAMTRFNKLDYPNWDGTHQDYLFLKKDFYLFTLDL